MSGDVTAVVLGLLLVAAVAGFALLPLVRGVREPLAAAPDSSAERFLFYRQVLELEFDLETGKLSQEDHDTIRDDLLTRAAALLRQEQGQQAAVDEEVEREIKAAREAFGRSGSLKAAPLAEARPGA